MAKTDIEKQFIFDYKEYKVTISRNKRKDCFLKITKVRDLKSYENPDIIIGGNCFLTVKSAKKKAIEIIEFFTDEKGE